MPFKIQDLASSLPCQTAYPTIDTVCGILSCNFPSRRAETECDCRGGTVQELSALREQLRRAMDGPHRV